MNLEAIDGLISNQPLAPLTTIGLGGNAQHYKVVSDPKDLHRALEWCGLQQLPMWVLSGGSNLVVADSTLRGLVVDMKLKGFQFEPVNQGRVLVTAAAGEDWDAFVAQCVARGYSGIECLSGIPGRVGATPIQNVGAYGQDVSQTIQWVQVLDRQSGDLLQMDASDCGFGYRASRFKHGDFGRYIVLSVCFWLWDQLPKLPSHGELGQHFAGDPGPPSASRVRDVVMGLRKSKSMLFDAADPWARSCGSFFLNPVVPNELAEAIRARYSQERTPFYPQPPGHVKIAAAWLIEKAGFSKGHCDGPVGLSGKHSLAIVARSGATARDVVRLARSIQSRVHEVFDIWITPEPVFWGFERFENGLPSID